MQNVKWIKGSRCKCQFEEVMVWRERDAQESSRKIRATGCQVKGQIPFLSSALLLFLPVTIRIQHGGEQQRVSNPAAAYNPDYKDTFKLHVKLFAFKSKEAGNTHGNRYSCSFSIYSAFDPQL